MEAAAADIREITPLREAPALEQHHGLHLAPLEMRVFYVSGDGGMGKEMISGSRKALYELRYEPDNRPDWAGVPPSGLLDLLSAP